MLPQMDFLKDMILVVRLITLLGGIIVVFKNPHLFSSVVSTFHLNRQNSLISVITISIHFLGDLSISCNNICSTIPGNHELCSFKSS